MQPPHQMIVIPDKWVFICSANWVRSPTAEYVARKAGVLARSCGTSHGFVVAPVSREILEWAHVIVCMEKEHIDAVRKFHGSPMTADVYCWNLPDDWDKAYDPQLTRIIEQKLLDTMQLRMTGLLEERLRLEGPDAGEL
jgi:predicted protein tyrosine phosphatase